MCLVGRKTLLNQALNQLGLVEHSPFEIQYFLACWCHHLFYWPFSDELGLARSAFGFLSPLVPVDPNGFPSRELEETTRTSPYHVAEHHPTRPQSLQPYTGWSSRSGSEPPSVEADVYIWRYALLMVYARKEEEDLFQKRTFGINGTGCIRRPDVLPAIQPAVSNHWMKHNALTVTWPHLFFVHTGLLVGTGVVVNVLRLGSQSYASRYV